MDDADSEDVIEGQTCSDLEEDAGVRGDAESMEERPWEVFISYRVNPDQVIAKRLKELIQGSLDPSPRVFVSGSGGLRPSAIGFRSQIQTAIQQSKVVVGVITPSSMSREWIFYEAGAAFGRGVTYAPVLCGVEFSSLPSTMDAYQATKVDDLGSIMELLRSISSEVGASVKKGQGRRLSSFLRKVARAVGGVDDGDRDDDEEVASVDGSIEAAREAWGDGDWEGARTHIQRARELCGDNQADLARVEVLAVTITSDSGMVALALEDMDHKYKESPEYDLQMWVHVMDYEPERAEASLLSYASKVGRSKRRHVNLQKARTLIGLGRSEQAVSLYRSMVCSDDKRERLLALEEVLRNQSLGLDAGERFVAGLGAMFAPSDIILEGLAKSSAELLIDEISGYCFEVLVERKRTGHRLHMLGISLNGVGCPSLAYEAFDEARGLGVQVSTATIAGLFGSGPVAVHGIKMLTEDGLVIGDAASKAYPPSVLQSLEESVEKERNQWESIRTRAKTAIRALSHITTSHIEYLSVAGVPGEWPDGKVLIHSDEELWFRGQGEERGGLASTLLTRTYAEQVVTIPGAYFVFVHQKKFLIITLKEDDVSAVYLSLSEDSALVVEHLTGMEFVDPRKRTDLGLFSV